MREEANKIIEETKKVCYKSYECLKDAAEDFW